MKPRSNISKISGPRRINRGTAFYLEGNPKSLDRRHRVYISCKGERLVDTSNEGTNEKYYSSIKAIISSSEPFITAMRLKVTPHDCFRRITVPRQTMLDFPFFV